MRTLKNLTRAELVELYDNNSQFAAKVDEFVWENQMFWQGEHFKDMGADVFDYHDHYQSFYLTVPTIYGGKAPEKIVGHLDEDYLTDEERTLYHKLTDLNAIMESAEEWDEERPEYQQMTDVADELARLITDDLRQYEHCDRASTIDELVSQASEGGMSDWETDGVKVVYHMNITLR